MELLEGSWEALESPEEGLGALGQGSRARLGTTVAAGAASRSISWTSSRKLQSLEGGLRWISTESNDL